MRPIRLDVEGFTAFRRPVTLDFSGADLFALSGPTGAGKSSVLDALCFALYGTVPRLDRRAVAPVVSTGLSEARVRLTFAVGDREYVAARVVRRLTSGGATTKEARLESGDVTVAGDADAVSRAVEELLGLGFEQFTTCVILPQGEFARFLHDRPADRQALLVRLLELDVYGRMRELANQRRATAAAERDAAERELATLAEATDEAVTAAAERIVRLEALRGELDAAQPRLDAYASEERAAAAEAEAAAETVRQLAAVRVPGGVAELAAGVAEAAAAAAAADRDLVAAERAVGEAEHAQSQLPDPRPLERAKADLAERAVLRERIGRGVPIVAEAKQAEARSAEELRAAEAAAQRSAGALEADRRRHAAAHLAAGVAVGDPCPVCDRPLDRPPTVGASGDLAARQRAVEDAGRRVREAAAGLRTAGERRVRAEEQLATLTAQADALGARLEGVPAPEEIDRLLDLVAKADAELSAARDAERAARSRRRAAAEAAAAQQQRAREAWAAFDAARDALAVLGPPPARREDLAASWDALAGWAAAQGPVVAARAAAAQARARRAAQEAGALSAELAQRCGAEGIAAGADRLRDACADALAAARAERGRLAAAVERAGKLRQVAAEASSAAEVAQSLGRHLAANGFERWLLDEALDRLAAGASDVLRELSSGQYSLEIDAQRNFLVVDHRSADERRPARTLSGGETFLASLALALTLADHLAELATSSRVRLESIFLDEGFGTLDPETLDVVASALEELGSRGRTVGLVTHVRDLAERLPVRFEVRRGPSGSTVERVAS